MSWKITQLDHDSLLALLRLGPTNLEGLIEKLRKRGVFATQAAISGAVNDLKRRNLVIQVGDKYGARK